ncbi:MAG: sensor histidine kinase KdpD [Methylobacteriaceae bacterium]|nr:sensor histidine kinase KdpD [Methylobacteriaceae bacterium]
MNDADLDDGRPSPEALLAQARREGRGKLKVFLGAAPGVGKTYEMLSDAHERRQGGADVVIGLVETHRRRETEALTRGLEIFPRKVVPYGGRLLTELDLDAVLARRPALVLIDELAHTNAPGSRHPKRYQDIEEVLDAGIDVFTTVNVQHLESLSDIVASFTRVRVRETVPDRILEEADAIEIVDVTPDELIERLKAGKIYVPDEATRALGHFFSKANLSALRELALRRAAQTVDRQVLEEVRAQALAGPWASGERVTVAIDDHPGGPDVIRAAKRLADGLSAPWTALHVETARDRRLTPAERERLSRHLRLASELGATVMTAPATTVARGILDHTRATRSTQIVVGKAKRSRLFELLRGSVVDTLVRRSEGAAVHVVSLEQAAQEGGPEGLSKLPSAAAVGRPAEHVAALTLVAGTTGAAHLLARALDVGNVSLLYLLPVVLVASRFGIAPAIVAAAASALAYNFFFLPPLYTFTIRDPENVLTFLILLLVGIVTAQLVARVRVQADLAADRARQNATLAGFSRTLNRATDTASLAWATCREAAGALDAQAVVLLPRDGELALAASHPPHDQLSLIDRAAADWAFTNARPAGQGADTFPGADWLFLPLRADNGALGVLGLGSPDGRAVTRADQQALVDAIVDQASVALDRLRLTEEMTAVAALQARDRARGALLSSVGHDLRTPLATVTGSIAELKRRLAVGEDGAGLLAGLENEAQRVDRLITNLLDMSRLEAGAMPVKPEPVDLVDAFASAEADLARQLGGRTVVRDVPDDLPLARLDPTLFHHCLLNLLDNAAKHADPSGPIEMRARRCTDGGLAVAVRDCGPGLPPEVAGRLLDTFALGEGSDRGKAGSGLGLAIIKGFADAMGLAVAVEPGGDGLPGTAVVLRIPPALVLPLAAASAEAAAEAA